MKNIIILLFFIVNLTVKAQWFTQNLPTSAPLSTVTCIDENTGIAAGISGTLIRTTDGGLNWEIQNSGTFEYLVESFHAYGGTSVYVIGNNGIIRKSTNNGASWFALQSPTTQSLHALYFSGDNYGYISGMNNSLFKTTDGGNNWEQLNTQLPSNTDLLSMAFISSQTGWVSGQSYSPFVRHLIYTTNGGNNWSSLNPPLNGAYGLGVGYNSQLSLYELWGRGGYNLYRSTNLGNNWAEINVPPGVSGSGDAITKLYCKNVNIVYVITSGNISPGIFVTTNSGQNWIRQLSASLQDIDFELYLQYGWAVNNVTPNTTIYRTTNGGGVLLVDPASSEIPAIYSLHQNYPNPFNPVTKIRFDIAKSSQAKIVVYDVLGNEVATLFNEYLKSGEYSITFDGSKLPSGMYLYRLNAGDFTETKKMIIVK